MLKTAAGGFRRFPALTFPAYGGFRRLPALFGLLKHVFSVFCSGRAFICFMRFSVHHALSGANFTCLMRFRAA
eukprot:3513788-Heterocapsa_arctica.AAC.1